MTIQETLNELANYAEEPPFGQGKAKELKELINNKCQGNTRSELLAVVEQGGYDPSQNLSTEALNMAGRLLSLMQSKYEPPFAQAADQSFISDGVTKVNISSTNSKGDNIKSVQTVGPNSSKSETDQGTMEASVGQVNKDNAADATEHTGGNSAKAVDGIDDSVAGEREIKTTSPGVVRANVPRAANAANAKIVAARTGFNDDRDDSIFSIIDEILAVPGEILEAITYIDSKKVQEEVDDGKTKSDNILTSLVDDITKEVGKYTKMWSRITADSAMKRAEAVIKNKKEKIEKTIKRIEKMKEGPKKNTFLTAVKSMDLSVLFSDPSNEKKEKKSIRDKDEEAKIAAEATKENIAAHSVQ